MNVPVSLIAFESAVQWREIYFYQQYENKRWRRREKLMLNEGKLPAGVHILLDARQFV